MSFDVDKYLLSVNKMDIYLILLTAICAILLIKLAWRLHKRSQFIAIINKIPGPRGYPILGNALELIRLEREDQYEWFQNLCSNHKGGIFRLWLGSIAHVHLTTAETVSIIMPSKNHITKSEGYDFINPWLGRGLLTSTGDEWHRQRKLLTPTFHYNILEEYAVVMSEKAEILKQCIDLQLKDSPRNPVDVSKLLTRCALDIICESAMGININAQTDHHAEYSVALHSLAIQTLDRIVRPWLHPDWIYYRTSRGKKFKRTVEIAHKFTNRVIRERKMARKIGQQSSNKDVRTNKPKRQAFLDHLLDACDRDNMPLTDEELRQEVDTFMFAGQDTTSAAMGWALFCIGNNPDVEEMIHQEQLEVFGDSAEPASLHQLSELKYLERVIKESMRLFPSAPGIGRSLTEDIEVAGYKIPKNGVVAIQINQVHRDPKHWPEPEKFDPDRFLPENSHGRHPYAYIPFSAGPRNCIGQKFALLEIKTILTTVLRKWRIRSLLKYYEVKCYADFILRPQDGIKMYFTSK